MVHNPKDRNLWFLPFLGLIIPIGIGSISLSFQQRHWDSSDLRHQLAVERLEHLRQNASSATIPSLPAPSPLEASPTLGDEKLSVHAQKQKKSAQITVDESRKKTVTTKWDDLYSEDIATDNNYLGLSSQRGGRSMVRRYSQAKHSGNGVMSRGARTSQYNAAYGKRHSCKELRPSQAQGLLLQGHSYLDRDGDGEACERDYRSSPQYSNHDIAPPYTPQPYTSSMSGNIIGPRGGCYRINSKGNKDYSKC